MPGADKETVIQRAEVLCKKISELVIIHDGKPLPTITASFGVAYLAKGLIVDKSMLIKTADLALYEAKNAGRNQVIVSTTQFNDLNAS